MNPTCPEASLPLLAVGLLSFWIEGVPVRARAAAPSAPAGPPPDYQVSGHRHERSLQGLLGFLHGFRLGQGLCGLSYRPVQPWYPPIVVHAPAQPANQQQIVNLLGANDLGENYQELNGHNVQVISGFAEPDRMNDSSIHELLGNIKSIVNETNTTINADSEQLLETHNSRVKVREAKPTHKKNSLAPHGSHTKKPLECVGKVNCTLKDPGNENVTTVPEVTTGDIDLTTSNQTDTSENVEPEVTEATIPVSHVIKSTTRQPETFYPNRTYFYPNGMLNNSSIDEISFTTDPSVGYSTDETNNPGVDGTFLHTLALPLEDNDWEHFSRIKLGDSGFRPISGNFYYS